jgi:hypothetical protein
MTHFWDVMNWMFVCFNLYDKLFIILHQGNDRTEKIIHYNFFIILECLDYLVVYSCSNQWDLGNIRKELNNCKLCFEQACPYVPDTELEFDFWVINTCMNINIVAPKQVLPNIRCVAWFFYHIFSYCSCLWHHSTHLFINMFEISKFLDSVM